MAQLAPFSTALSVVPVRPSAPRAPLARVRVEAQFYSGKNLIRSQSSVPLMPGLLSAFAGFTHGTEFAMAEGPSVAVEDLEPGMELRAPNGETMPIQWIGSVELMPAMLARLGTPDAPALVRILPDRFGYARPARDIVVAGCTQVSTGSSVKPAHALVDYEAVLPVTPPGPVRMFQLVCTQPLDLIANGLGAPSFSLSNWLSVQNPLMQDVLADVLPDIHSGNLVA